MRQLTYKGTLQSALRWRSPFLALGLSPEPGTHYLDNYRSTFHALRDKTSIKVYEAGAAWPFEHSEGARLNRHGTQVVNPVIWIPARNSATDRSKWPSLVVRAPRNTDTFRWPTSFFPEVSPLVQGTTLQLHYGGVSQCNAYSIAYLRKYVKYLSKNKSCYLTINSIIIW